MQKSESNWSGKAGLALESKVLMCRCFLPSRMETRVSETLHDWLKYPARSRKLGSMDLCASFLVFVLPL